MTNDVNARAAAGSMLAALLILSGTAVAEPPPPAGDYHALLEQATAAKDRGDWEATYALLQQAYALKPSPQLLNNIGKSLEQLNRYAEAYATYERVSNDPEAPMELRAFEVQRLGALQPKLGKAWVVIKGADKVLVDGDDPGVAPGTEIAAAPGRRVFEYPSADGAATTLVVHDLPAGRQTVVHDAQDGAGLSTLDLAAMPAPIEALSIDRYRVRADLRHLARVRLPAGAHRLDVTLRGGAPQTLDLTLAAGAPLALAPRVKAPVAKTPDPPPVIRDSGGLPKNAVWQIVTGAAGAAMLGVGTWLLIDAQSQRDDVNDAVLPNGVVVGLTMGQAQEKQDSADTRTAAGASLVAVGAAAGVAAVVWAIVDASGDGRTTMIAPTGNGLVVGGRF